MAVNNGNLEDMFSVYQFFLDGSHEKVLYLVPAEEAVKCVQKLTTSLGANLGTTARVIITDWGDCIVLEWIHGKGIVFPQKEYLDGSKQKRTP